MTPDLARRTPAVRRRDAPAQGLARHELRRTEWRRVSYGLYTRPTADPSPADVARAVAHVLPTGSGFGHLTSVGLRDWWLPNRVTVPPGLLLASTTSNVHVQRQGLYVRRSAYATAELVEGLPVMTAAETLIELARDLVLVDLVPMVDRALAAGTTPDEVLRAARPRSNGARVLRRALALADPRSESWWESMLRLVHVLSGLGPVECQVPIGLTFRADLHLVGTDRYPECDGSHHRDRDRHGRDLRRDKDLMRLGAQRYAYTTAEIAHQPAMIIADAEGARGLPHDPRRVARWWTFARESTLTGHGRARLKARLQRYQLAARR